MKSYLFILGRNPELSRAELVNFCDEVLYEEDKALFIGENLKFENPREIPRAPEQLFLDRLGGTIRFGEILDEFFSEDELKNAIIKQINQDKPEGKVQLGVSAWGCGRSFLRKFLPEMKNLFRNKHDRNCRIANNPGENLDSGQIFGGKLLRKGFEFLVWKRGNSFLLAKTVANQNLRNYTLRDRDKEFRDSKMGMLPPKVAQILMNLANPTFEQTVIDPFCGSGTVNIEAAITGFKTIGSDIEDKHTKSARKNFDQMAEKFRYVPTTGEFFQSDAIKFPFKDYEHGIIVTEGTLGKNFEKLAHHKEIEENSREILELWTKVFAKLENSDIKRIVLCLPAWNTRTGTVSISEKLFAKINRDFEVLSLFDGKKSFIYARPDAYVGREICVVERK